MIGSKTISDRIVDIIYIKLTGKYPPSHIIELKRESRNFATKTLVVLSRVCIDHWEKLRTKGMMFACPELGVEMTEDMFEQRCELFMNMGEIKELPTTKEDINVDRWRELFIYSLDYPL